MATKKTGAAAKKTAKKSSSTARKTTTKKAPTKVTTVRSASAATTQRSVSSKLGDNLVNILLAELVGTFVLVTVALMTASDVLPLYIGLTLAVLVMVIGGVSGSHVNPAVTFGLWASRKLNTVMVPFYWVAQMVGGIAALLVANAVAGSKFSLDFGHFGEFAWPIFFVEMIGTAVFLFGLVSVVNRTDLAAGAKAFGVGLSLFVGIVVSSSMFAAVSKQAVADYQASASEQQSTGKNPEIPHSVLANGATLNPAVALAATEKTEAELTTGQAGADEARYSRLGWETILSTLIGAAVGGNLALLVAYRFRS